MNGMQRIVLIGGFALVLGYFGIAAIHAFALVGDYRELVEERQRDRESAVLVTPHFSLTGETHAD